MTLTGNKGEWSEIYAFFKLLGEGKVYAGDQNLNKIQDLFYPIVMILREERDEKYNYRILEERDIVIETPAGIELLRIPASVFLDKAEKLLSTINSNKGTFGIPLIEEFMNKIHCYSLKAKSSDKTDIRIVLHDRRTKMNSEMGFSIKSQLGGDSTLLNASKATNFTFKVDGLNIDDAGINKINSINTPKKKVIERYKAIKSLGGKLSFYSIDNKTFLCNLTMLDGHLPSILGEMLIEQLETGESTLSNLAQEKKKKNPMRYELRQEQHIYEYKIKHLLTTTALGMMPASIWNGKYDANGGYLVVKQDGDILCYHFYDRNRFEDYLFHNAYLERSSTTRHEYATLYRNNNNALFFKLNLQIRLK